MYFLPHNCPGFWHRLLDLIPQRWWILNSDWSKVLIVYNSDFNNKSDYNLKNDDDECQLIHSDLMCKYST